MLNRSKLVPELMVTDLGKSLEFWVACLGFTIAYQRADEGFAYLDLDGAQIMLEQINPLAGQWVTGPLNLPLGRGLNLQIDVRSVQPIIEKLEQAGRALFRDCKDAWYTAEESEVGQREFLVQDPDGYLVRLVERLGVRDRQTATPAR
ncbi:VOC family protein [Pseudomonas seleniipraecipitans]|uniref:Bleomycin resistance protein n=1 Tax=Phytopseudomonas seleniipraecipitans TaxID=640205 RepID=A0ABY5J7C6_9GAMM|nr:VOC family protein [Pseudomonas seleniipraecipitans]UUD63545.1 VOC family protein [Pseudomonas seleniipraecipitans]